MHPARRRAFEIAAVATRHAAGALFDCLDLWYLFPQTFRPVVARRSPAAIRLRRALEDLGPTFMKLGQVLSTRPDLVPPHVPPNLEVPAGNKVFLVGHAAGTQQYVCLFSGSSFAWTFFGP